MLTVAEETLKQLAAEHGKQVVTHLYGQEINPETYAICKADMLLKGEGENADNIVGGAEWSTLSHDAFPAREFDFMLSNPPYGKSWKRDLEAMGGKDGMRDPRFKVMHDGEELSLVTRSSDGQLLFLANMLSKMNDKTPLGSRIAEVHNGSSLFTGDAGQGESNIRRWIIENDWLEAIVALPLNMFYNTGIATYVWVLSNRKPEHRRGKVQLIDATQWFKPLRKNLGKKNCELSADDIAAHLRHLPRLRGNRAVEDLPQRRLRLLEGHRRAPAAPAQPAHAQGDRDAALRLRRRGHPRASSTTSFGDALFADFANDSHRRWRSALAEWGERRRATTRTNGDEAPAKKGLPEKKKKKLLDAKTWERDGKLVEVATALREELGGELFEDHNVFRERVDAALEEARARSSPPPS